LLGAAAIPTPAASDVAEVTARANWGNAGDSAGDAAIESGEGDGSTSPAPAAAAPAERARSGDGATSCEAISGAGEGGAARGEAEGLRAGRGLAFGRERVPPNMSIVAPAFALPAASVVVAAAEEGANEASPLPTLHSVTAGKHAASGNRTELGAAL
jgi:hypothetical protein